MYKHEDILIVGDSFCFHRETEEHWPYILCKLLTNNNRKPRGKGFPGASWWSTRKNLLNELKIKVPKVLVICHTNHPRIPSDLDLALNVTSAFNAKYFYNNLTKESAASGYYFRYLYCDEFHLWAQSHWFQELDIILNKLSSIEKVVHIFNFSITPLFPFNKGVIIADRLDQYMILDIKTQIYFNHLTKEKNIELANCLYNIIVHQYKDMSLYNTKLFK